MEKTTKKIETVIQSTIERIMRVSNAIRISKDGKNSFQNYEYFKPDDINKAIVPVLIEHGLYTKFDMTFNSDKQVYEGTLRVGNFENKDDIEIYSLDVKEAIVKGSSPVQCSGATMTYLKRYMLMNAFNLADNKDDPDSHAPIDKSKAETATKETVAKNETVKTEQDININVQDGAAKIRRELSKCKDVNDLNVLYKSLKGKDPQTYLEYFTKRKLELVGGNGNGK